MQFTFPVIFLPPQRPALFPTYLHTVLHQYILDIRKLPKEKNLERGRDITGLLEVNVQGGCLMEKEASRDAFDFARDVIGSPRRRTIIDMFDVIVLKCIIIPLFVSLEMFSV